LLPLLLKGLSLVADLVRGFRGKKMPTTVCCSFKRAAKEKAPQGGASVISWQEQMA
jgi:hypothetical protein